jgi:hypothetical protein
VPAANSARNFPRLDDILVFLDEIKTGLNHIVNDFKSDLKSLAEQSHSNNIPLYTKHALLKKSTRTFGTYLSTLQLVARIEKIKDNNQEAIDM